MARDFEQARTVHRTELWQGSIGRFGEEEVELASGKRIKLAVLKHPGAAAVVPLVDNGTVLLLRQYRHAAGGTLWEVPAGKLDPGEAPETCALRELEEETGYRAGRLQSLGTILTTPGFTDEVIHLYAAHDLQPGTQNLEASEIIETTEVPLAQAVDMAVRGDIHDAKSVVALLRAHHARRPGP